MLSNCNTEAMPFSANVPFAVPEDGAILNIVSCADALTATLLSDVTVTRSPIPASVVLAELNIVKEPPTADPLLWVPVSRTDMFPATLIVSTVVFASTLTGAAQLCDIASGPVGAPIAPVSTRFRGARSVVHAPVLPVCVSVAPLATQAVVVLLRLM